MDSTQERSQEGEKRGSIYAWTEYYLQPGTVGRHCARSDYYLQAVICRSLGGLSANEKEEKFASNHNDSYERVNFYKQVLSMTLSPQKLVISANGRKAYASQLFNAF